MKISKIKFFGGMLVLAASLSLTTPLNTMATRETDEILYEDTEDENVLEDITNEEQVEYEKENNQDSETKDETTNNTLEKTKTKKPTETNPLENTDIDEEDQEYNTGRTEIPDSVKTEWERKIEETNPDPEKPNSVPKTGVSPWTFVLIGGALGLITSSGIALHTEYQLANPGEKVIKSRKKYKKRNKTRKI